MQIKSFAGYSGDSNLCKNNRNGYSPAKGCLGSLLFGSGGWLLGALGQRQRTIIETQNRNYWICNDCGYKFRNTEDWHEEIKKKEQAVKVNLVLTIFFYYRCYVTVYRWWSILSCWHCVLDYWSGKCYHFFPRKNKDSKWTSTSWWFRKFLYGVIQ